MFYSCHPVLIPPMEFIAEQLAFRASGHGHAKTYGYEIIKSTNSERYCFATPERAYFGRYSSSYCLRYNLTGSDEALVPINIYFLSA